MRVREMIYTLYFYGSPYYKNTNLHHRKMVLTRENIQGMHRFIFFDALPN